MILIVEDDRMLMMGLQVALKTKGSQVLPASSVREALSVYDQQADSIDFVLLDMRLPDGTGMEVCRHIRRLSAVPIIFLTACDDEKNAVEALGSGGDDYITKPFHLRELLARMDAIRRRSAPHEEKKTTFRVGENVIDIRKGRVERQGKEILLSAVEYRLLLVFLQNRGQLLRRNQILSFLWDEGGEFVNDNTLTVYIRRLRQKLDDEAGKQIETVRGMGYRLREDS
ncbi:response regulator transcription factor [Porcincola intestinalis]|uniref:response regulator transcription factor n=1 Tax=Porcincola intestinalis TaxID=2606632 RepID=UPI002A839956|nr:response regulator transcription factor [Porcincola intestinalis]MCI6698076.1 response regulator transcription factor [Lachnospiraceae bacterium]MDY4205333.1 response regulator transcription factor [Porcincola intestinalis]